MSELVLTDENALKAQSNNRDRWLGIMSAFAVAWYSFCLLVFVMMLSMGEKTLLGLYSENQLTYLISTPFWVNIANAVSILAGLIGSVYLLLRRKSAYYWFTLCLGSLMLIMLDASLRDGFHIMGASLLGISIIGFIIGIYLFWAAYLARDQGDLNAT